MCVTGHVLVQGRSNSEYVRNRGQELENKLLKALLGSIATIITILMAAWRFLK